MTLFYSRCAGGSPGGSPGGNPAGCADVLLTAVYRGRPVRVAWTDARGERRRVTGEVCRVDLPRSVVVRDNTATRARHVVATRDVEEVAVLYAGVPQ